MIAKRNSLREKLISMLVIAFVIAMLATAIVPTHTVFGDSTIYVTNLEPSWSTADGQGGVFSAYVGPPSYGYVSPGTTAVYDGREAGIIKAGLVEIPGNIDTWDEGLFAFIPSITIDALAAGTLSYDVENQEGTNPVWMTIEIDTGVVGNRADNTTYQHVPTTNPASWHTVNAAAGQWQKWNDGAGDTTGNPLISLSAVATAHSGCNVVRAYLRLGLGDSYHGTGSGTVGWVDKVTISTMTYDFVVAPATNSATGSGTVTLNADGGTFEDVAAVAESALPTTGKPSLTFPNGFFSFNIFGLTPGDTVTVTLTMPSAIPVGTQYWKYGPTSSNPGGEWYQITMGDDDGDNVITIPLTDGGLGDDDLTANGVIVDQGGPGSPPVPTPTPTPAPAKVGGTGLFPPDNSGSSSTPYAVIIGTSLAAIATLALGTWFARRHWLKRCS